MHRDGSAQVPRRLIENNMHILSHDCSTKMCFFLFFHFFGNFIWRHLRHRFAVEWNKVCRNFFFFLFQVEVTRLTVAWTISSGTKQKMARKKETVGKREPTLSQSYVGWRRSMFHDKRKNNGKDRREREEKKRGRNKTSISTIRYGEINKIYSHISICAVKRHHCSRFCWMHGVCDRNM